MGPGRILPVVDADNAHFWHSGDEGRLSLLRCQGCGFWLHPPGPVCRRCHIRRLAPETVSGQGVVFAFTVNHHRWRSDMDVPFTLAIVELAEQRDLRLLSQIVGCAPEEVYSGLPVEVRFVAAEDVWLPVFGPARERPQGRDPQPQETRQHRVKEHGV